jgi:hypothetical protein
MSRKTLATDAGTTREEAQLNAFVDDIAPRSPTVKVYRIEDDGKQKILVCHGHWFLFLEHPA